LQPESRAIAFADGSLETAEDGDLTIDALAAASPDVVVTRRKLVGRLIVDERARGPVGA
jgi:hypothetical protein